MELIYNKSAAHLDKLKSELSGISGCTGISFCDGSLTVMFNRELSQEEQGQVETIVANHSASNPEQSISNAVGNAMDFGRSLIIAVATENLMLGITTAQLQAMMAKTQGIVLLLMTGSLYTALEAIDNLEPDDFLTQARITAFGNKIRAYLGLPLE